jgi:hypothetical protein
MTAPLVVVFKSDPEAMEEMVKFVVDAFVEVIAVVEAFVIVVTPVKERFVVVEFDGNGYPKVVAAVR